MGCLLAIMAVMVSDSGAPTSWWCLLVKRTFCINENRLANPDRQGLCAEYVLEIVERTTHAGWWA